MAFVRRRDEGISVGAQNVRPTTRTLSVPRTLNQSAKRPVCAWDRSLCDGTAGGCASLAHGIAGVNTVRLVGLEERAASEGGATAALIMAAIRGERDAQRQVWEDHRRWVAAVLMAHKPRAVDLEDLLQDVAMQFVRRIHELRDAGALRPWLRTVAMNAAHASGRTLARRKRDTLERRPAATSGALGTTGAAGTAPVDAKPDLLTGRREEARRLMELSERLPDGYREPLLLRCLQGLSYRLIGELMGIPETTVETRIARGRRMLRELAEKDAQSASSKPTPAIQIEHQGIETRAHATDGGIAQTNAPTNTQHREARTQDGSANGNGGETQ